VSAAITIYSHHKHHYSYFAFTSYTHDLYDAVYTGFSAALFECILLAALVY